MDKHSVTIKEGASLEEAMKAAKDGVKIFHDNKEYYVRSICNREILFSQPTSLCEAISLGILTGWVIKREIEGRKMWIDKPCPICSCPEPEQVPQINPLLIPIDWWGVALFPDGQWHRYETEPTLIYSEVMRGWSTSRERICIPPRHYPKNYTGNWESSRFSREELAKVWKGENE